MPLIKNGTVIEDRFVRILDEAPVPDDVAVLVPAARLLADAGEILGRSGATGVLWPNDRNISELAPHLDRLALVALVLPNFRDGRAYSQARILRERYRFRGELRATGQVLRDQFLLLHRAGFDAYEVSKAADAPAFIKAMATYSVFYQPTGDGRLPAMRARLGRLKTDVLPLGAPPTLVSNAAAAEVGLCP
jgi:uncharacterized protein (DUF934 family)